MEMPGQWPDVRAALEERAAAEGPEALYAELLAADPTAAARIEPANARRIVRALEVVLGSGRMFSSFGPGLDHYPPIDMVQVGLRWNRDVLARRIEERVHRMVSRGLFAEVATLWDGGRGALSRTARQALGYKEILDALEANQDLGTARDLIKTRTRQFAKRQCTWFRNLEECIAIPLDANDSPQTIAAQLEKRVRS